MEISSNKKVLFISIEDVFSKVNNGGNQCSKRNLEMLRRIYGKENIQVCIIYDMNSVERDDSAIYINAMTNKIKRFIYSFFLDVDITGKDINAIENIIRENSYDIIYCDNSRLGKIVKRVRNKFKNIKIISFAHNVERDIFIQRVKKENFLYLPIYWAVCRVERWSLKYSDLFIALSKRDKEHFKEYYKISPDLLIPITFEDTKKQPAKPVKLNSNSLLFVGSTYLPNVKGIKWFVENVMPNMDATLYIIGKGMERYRKELEKKNVVVVGTVDSINDYYFYADAVVIPIFEGGGMKVKTAEALMHGKRIFATTEALSGYETDSEGISCCNSADEFITSIVRYFSGEVVRELQSVRNIFMSHYETESYVNILRKKIDQILNNC